MPYDEFAELRDMYSELEKTTPNKFINGMPSLSDYLDKIPLCPKCKAAETFINRNGKYECAVCDYEQD